LYLFIICKIRDHIDYNNMFMGILILTLFTYIYYTG